MKYSNARHVAQRAVSMALALLPLAAGAQTAVSLTSSGAWSDASRWNPATVPNNAGASSYLVTLGAGRTATLDIDVTVSSLSLGGSSSAFTTLALNPGRTLAVNGPLSAGLYSRFNGGGTLTLNSPNAASGSAQNAALSFDNVTFNIGAGSVFADGAANGAFATSLANGAVINNAGTYSLDGAGSSISSGGGATSSFNNSGTLRGAGSISAVAFNNTGAINSTGILTFGVGGSSSGTVNTGTTAYSATQFSSGTWNFTSASVNAGAGKFIVAGATVTLNGAHNVTGTTLVSSGALNFVNSGRTVNALAVTGGSTTLVGSNTIGQFDLGAPGSGGGTAIVQLGSNGTLSVTGAFNTGTYSQVNGSGSSAITVRGGGSIGDNSALVLSGVVLHNAAGSTLSQFNAGGFDNTLQNGAVINNDGSWLLKNQNGRGWVAASGAAGAGAAFNNSGTLWANVSYTNANIAMPLNNSGVVRLDSGVGGGGNPTLTVASYTQTAGSTELAHDVGNFATLASSGAMRFMAGALVGNGRLLGAVAVSGADTLVSPGYDGMGIGMLNVQGSYAQTGGKLALDIGRTSAGSAGTVRDTLTSTGALGLAGTAIVVRLVPGSLALQLGDSFTVLSSSANLLSLVGVTTSFEGVLSGYTFSQSVTGSSYILTLTSAVPEPATAALFTVAALLLCPALRRRQRGTC